MEQHTKNYEDVRRWSYLRKSQEEDRIIKLLKEKIETKWKRKDSSRELDRYYQNRQYLSLIQECVMFQNRIIIPEIEKQRVLKEIHNAHQGVTRCIASAKESVWWFGITEDIKAHVGSCIQCMIYENKKIETLEMIPIPKGPWEMLGTDIFQLSGKKYLLVVDYYSKYIELAFLEKGENSGRIIEKLKSIFSRHGIPDQVISDNGPQYASLEFKEFTKVYKYKHITSSPRYPKGNGMAERAVKTVKRLLEKCEDPYLSMLEFRTTPLEFGLSPGELLMN